MEQQAMADAARADAEIKAGRYRGPLHGIPYGVKDLFSTKGVRTTWGSADFENRIIDEDAEIVVRLRDAGAVLVAKLATGLFALGDQWYRGRTNNPWDVRRGSSGSSAGPSSATAAGCVAFGIGTETSGSIVSPARECGMSALRPTFGRVSRYGGMVLAWSQDRVGPICRTVEDCAMVFNVLHGVDPKDPSTVMVPFHFDPAVKVSTLRIGMDPAAPKEFIDGLRELGAAPKEIGARPSTGGGGTLGVESAAAFDSYVQWKAKELGIDLASIPEPSTGLLVIAGLFGLGGWRRVRA
jgi:Asp-tRNA(Asn)/Glu-tRNA(Gln) amidotransferase A subunit family amidase